MVGPWRWAYVCRSIPKILTRRFSRCQCVQIAYECIHWNLLGKFMRCDVFKRFRSRFIVHVFGSFFPCFSYGNRNKNKNVSKIEKKKEKYLLFIYFIFSTLSGNLISRRNVVSRMSQQLIRMDMTPVDYPITHLYKIHNVHTFT